MNKFFISYINYFLHLMFLFIMLLFLMNMNNHPIMIMIIILIYSSLICLNMSLWKSNYILSIFLFLMMISGLLIIFLYFSSLISNVQFKLKPNLIAIFLFMINSMFMFYIFKYNNTSIMLIYKYKFHENNPLMLINKSTFNYILNLYEYPLNNLTILSMFYLLFSLFIIIKICSSKSISLRKIN
uniref:NADH dehydrogenase subunit 6 n=1 Tax=Camponotus vafer TaxID=251259 RepID=G9J3G1_9HYME|nr:NADH dehydrogenase subunit 6 [Camponotus vafer]